MSVQIGLESETWYRIILIINIKFARINLNLSEN